MKIINKYLLNENTKRYKIINFIIQNKNYKSYLEIGCYKNETFSKIKCKLKIGVDPVIGGNIKKTSDDFFKTNIRYFDIIFIDGLHLHEQVTRDINNSIKFLNEKGIIVLHDCNPLTKEFQKEYYSGDVWKSICLCRTDKNKDILTINVDSGIGLIKKRKNKNILSLNKKYKNLNYKDLVQNRKKFLNLKDIYKDKKEIISFIIND